MKIIFLLIVLFAFSTIAFSQWTLQSPLPYQINLNSVFFTDENNGWIVGDGSYIFNTSDGGRNWQSHILEYPKINYNSIFSTKKEDGKLVGYIAGENGRLIKFTNGPYGIIHEYLTTHTTATLHSAYFITSDTGFYCGNLGTILRTWNGGLGWNGSSSQTNYNLESIFFTNGRIGYCVGGQNNDYSGIILKTANGGDSWNTQFIEINETYLYSVYFINNDIGWASGWKGTILKTTNGGITWNKCSSNTTSHIRSIKFIDSNNGIAVGSNGTILKSTDGGESWIVLQSNTTEKLNSVFTINKNKILTVGDNGIILLSEDTGNSWYQLYIHNKAALKSVSAPTKEVCYISTLDNLYKTTDSGKSWILIKNLDIDPFYITKIKFIDADNGWLLIHDLSGNHFVLITNDGGKSWTRKMLFVYDIQGNLEVLDLDFFDKDNGWILGNIWYSYGIVFITNDGGHTWKEVSLKNLITETFQYYQISKSIEFISKDIGWISGTIEYNGEFYSLIDFIIKTTDGGLTWERLYPKEILSEWDFFAYNRTISSSFFTDEYNGYFLGNNEGVPFLIKTDDGGKTLIKNDSIYNIFYNPYPYFSNINFTSENEGYILGDGMLKTTDKGESWFREQIDSLHHFHAASFSDKHNGWVVGDSGIFYQYKGVPIDTVITNLNAQNKISIPKEFRLLQNYPNPFNPDTKIMFELPEKSKVNLLVYSVLGDQIYELINSELDAGYHEAVFHADQFPSGIYFYQLITGKHKGTKKMILVK